MTKKDIQTKTDPNHDNGTDSDAHFYDNVGDVYNVIYMEHRTFAEFRMALKGEEGRYIDTMAFRSAPLKKIM